MNDAAELLQCGDPPLADVALQAGFANRRHTWRAACAESSASRPPPCEADRETCFVRVSSPQRLFWSLTATTPQQDMHRLTGRYECRQRDSGGQTWRLPSPSMDRSGSWLRLDATYPAQNGQPAGTAITFVGFDAAAKRWSIVSVSADGSYYTRYSTSRDFNGCRSGSTATSADGGKAVVKVISSGEYTFDFASPTGPGKTARSHTVCTKT